MRFISAQRIYLPCKRIRLSHTAAGSPLRMLPSLLSMEHFLHCSSCSRRGLGNSLDHWKGLSPASSYLQHQHCPMAQISQNNQFTVFPHMGKAGEHTFSQSILKGILQITMISKRLQQVLLFPWKKEYPSYLNVFCYFWLCPKSRLTSFGSGRDPPRPRT